MCSAVYLSSAPHRSMTAKTMASEASLETDDEGLEVEASGLRRLALSPDEAGGRIDKALAARLRFECGVNAIAVETAEEECRGADIVVEATRLEKPTLLIRDEWLKPRCLLITYGWKMAVDPKTACPIPNAVTSGPISSTNPATSMPGI